MVVRSNVYYELQILHPSAYFTSNEVGCNANCDKSHFIPLYHVGFTSRLEIHYSEGIRLYFGLEESHHDLEFTLTLIEYDE